MIDNYERLVGRLMDLETKFYELQEKYHTLINDYESIKDSYEKLKENCCDKSQCWEPCGELGKNEKYARVYNGSN